MHELLLVRRFERLGDLAGDPQLVGERKGTLTQAPVQRVAFDVLHDDERGIVHLEELEDPADERVIERGGGERFAPEPLPRHGIAGQMPRQSLDRDAAIEAGVPRAVDLALPPAPMAAAIS